MFKHILVPTDGSELSVRAIQAAVEFSARLGARVTGFYAAPAPTPIVYGDLLPAGYLPPDRHEALIDAARTRYLGAVEAAARAAGVRCDTASVTSEFPAEAIVEAAQRHGCDLVFMASHGRRGLAGLLLGSETQKVLVHSRIPVLVFR
jgi:nucleotide-binding universal stress UspA family protein